MHSYSHPILYRVVWFRTAKTDVEMHKVLQAEREYFGLNTAVETIAALYNLPYVTR